MKEYNWCLLLSFILIAFCVKADNFSSTYLKLYCPGRGVTQFIFHRYFHTEESWKGGFETGAGHKVENMTETTSFQNGDVLLHRLLDDAYFIHYGDNEGVVNCSIYTRKPVTVVTLPYFNESRAS